MRPTFPPPFGLPPPTTLVFNTPPPALPPMAAAAMAAATIRLCRPMISEGDIHRRLYLTKVDQELRDRSSDWQEYITPDQKIFYFNKKTNERTWNKPDVIKELDDAITVIKEEVKAQEKSANQQQLEEIQAQEKSTNQQQQQPQATQAQEKSATNQQQRAMKPVSTTAIPGSPWCIVWTDKNRVFYFNPSTKTSVWDRPTELLDRKDVDQMITSPVSTTQQQNDQSSAQAEKKIKLDPKPAIAPKIVKKEVVSEVEKEAAKKRETISFEERVETFRKMLEEKEVKINSTFQKELSKIVFDPRYLLLTSNERREVFERYCLEKTEEERRKRRDKIKKATDDFKALLDEANLSSRSIYDEFHSKYSKEPRFKAVEKTKDREMLFEDHLAMLRRKEREERSRKKRRSPGRGTSSRRKDKEINRDFLKKKENFELLLKETKLINKDTRRKIEESEHQHLIDIIGTLQDDKRYIEMEPYSEERRKILLSYIEQLAAV